MLNEKNARKKNMKDSKSELFLPSYSGSKLMHVSLHIADVQHGGLGVY
jgi:hypothetical protein